MVGGVPTPLKNMSSSVGMVIPFPIERQVIKIDGSKPPTRYAYDRHTYSTLW